jgi:hypothetical protein
MEIDNMNNYLEIKGNNYEVGYAVGRYWGKYFQQCRKKYRRVQERKKRQLIDNYIDWLSSCWKNEFAPLLRNTAQYFPEVINEVAGMEKGVNDSGLRTSFVNIFSLCLGETGDPGYHCSSIVAKTKNGYVMGTNDEDCTVDPLLLAKVSLKSGNLYKKFVSISHPFQLFGSAAGMNMHIAFQGNSIGFPRKVYNKLKTTWGYRIPKTVLSRKMLDLDSIEEIKHLLQSCHSTLPNHHYIISHDKAVSVNVVPKLDKIDCSQGNSVKITKIKDRHFHTNHFLIGNQSQRKSYLTNETWEWSWPNDLNNSKERYKKLNDKLEKKSLLDIEGIKEILLGMAKEYKSSTSASLLFEMHNRWAFCENFFYFELPSDRSFDTSKPGKKALILKIPGTNKRKTVSVHAGADLFTIR